MTRFCYKYKYYCKKLVFKQECGIFFSFCRCLAHVTHDTKAIGLVHIGIEQTHTQTVSGVSPWSLFPSAGCLSASLNISTCVIRPEQEGLISDL